MRVAARIELTTADRQRLETRARARSLLVRVVERCRIVLRAAAGESDVAIASAMGITRPKSARWRQRFLSLGVKGLERDAPQPGRVSVISAARKARIVRRTTQETPDNATRKCT